MNRADLTEKILDIKREKGWTWKYICEEIGGMSPLLITGALLCQMKLQQNAQLHKSLSKSLSSLHLTN